MEGKNMSLIIEEEDSKFWEEIADEIANNELEFLNTSKTTISSTRTERCKPLTGVLKDRDYFWTKVGNNYKMCLGNGEVLYCAWVFDNFYEVVKISEKSEDGKFANFTEEKITFDIVFLTKALEIAEEYATDYGIKPEKDADWYADDYTDEQRALFSKLSEHFDLNAIPIEEPSSDPTGVGVFTIREAVELLSLISSKPATLNQRLEITERNLHPRPDLLSGLEACILLGNVNFYTDFDYVKDSLISPKTFSENFSKIWDD